MTRDELLAALLVERFGEPTPQHHNPQPVDDDAWFRLRVLQEATKPLPLPEEATG